MSPEFQSKLVKTFLASLALAFALIYFALGLTAAISAFAGLVFIVIIFFVYVNMDPEGWRKTFLASFALAFALIYFAFGLTAAIYAFAGLGLIVIIFLVYVYVKMSNGMDRPPTDER